MKRIKSCFDQKDRVVCVTHQCCHEFYYQPIGTRQRILLFITDEFTGSVFAYFRNKGRSMNGSGFSLTLRELYAFKHFRDVKLTSVISRIPVMIDYVLNECLDQKKAKKETIVVRKQTAHCSHHEQRELAA